MNESYLHDQRTKRQLALLDKFLAVRRQYSHVAMALIGICLFEMSLNAILNRLSVQSWRYLIATMGTDAPVTVTYHCNIKHQPHWWYYPYYTVTVVTSPALISNAERQDKEQLVPISEISRYETAIQPLTYRPENGCSVSWITWRVLGYSNTRRVC